MKRVVLLGLLVLTVGAADASAAVRPGATTIVVEDGSPDWPYQRWVNRARAPTPALTVTLAESLDGCVVPDRDVFYGCWDDQALTLHIAAGQSVFFHELGHAYAQVHLDGNEAAQFQRLDRYRGDPNERFANAYAGCAVYAHSKMKPLLVSICRFIRSAY